MVCITTYRLQSPDKMSKQGGYSAARAEENKSNSFANEYDTDKYEFLPWVMEFPSRNLSKNMQISLEPTLKR